MFYRIYYHENNDSIQLCTYKKSLINNNWMRNVVQVNGDFNGLNSIFRTR